MVLPRKELTQERLKELLRYLPESGRFVWRAKPRRRDSEPGTVNKDGYLDITIDKKKYPAHRLAWFYMTGAWPAVLIDHWNRKRLDNSWENLREATVLENNRNKEYHEKAGVRVVGNRFYARLNVEGRMKHIGSYGTFEEAKAAYLKAKEKYHT